MDTKGKVHKTTDPYDVEKSIMAKTPYSKKSKTRKTSPDDSPISLIGKGQGVQACRRHNCGENHENIVSLEGPNLISIKSALKRRESVTGSAVKILDRDLGMRGGLAVVELGSDVARRHGVGIGVTPTKGKFSKDEEREVAEGTPKSCHIF